MLVKFVISKIPPKTDTPRRSPGSNFNRVVSLHQFNRQELREVLLNLTDQDDAEFVDQLINTQLFSFFVESHLQ